MSNLNECKLLDHFRNVGSTTSSPSSITSSKQGSIDGLRPPREVSSSFKYDEDSNVKETDKIMIYKNTCLGCLHAEVCKYKHQLDTIMTQLKDLYIEGSSLDDSNNIIFNIHVTCNRYFNTGIQSDVPVTDSPSWTTTTTDGMNVIDCLSEKDNYSDIFEISKKDFVNLVEHFKNDDLDTLDDDFKIRFENLLVKIVRCETACSITDPKLFDWDSYINTLNKLSNEFKFLI